MYENQNRPSILSWYHRWISEMYIAFESAMQKKAEPTLALKPQRDVTRNLKQGYQWPQNRTCECVRQNKLLKGLFDVN